MRACTGAAASRPPYKSYRRDTPPGVSGPHQKKKDRVRFSVSLRGGHRPTWQSPATPCVFVQCSRRFPEGELARRAKRCHPGVRGFASRNDRWGDRAVSPGIGSCLRAHCGTPRTAFPTRRKRPTFWLVLVEISEAELLLFVRLKDSRDKEKLQPFGWSWWR